MEQHTAQVNDPIPLRLHAEYLPNIRQVSLQISIPANAEPEISLSESRRAVSVSVSLPEPIGDVSETMKLPVRASEASRGLLRASNLNPNLHSSRSRNEIGTGTAADNSRDGRGVSGEEREFSYRMQVDDEEYLRRQRDTVEETMDSFVPWAADDMKSATGLRCRACERVFLDAATANATISPLQSEGTDTDKVQPVGWVWKDLPSGNWAEMMDFWHCHKPDPREDGTDGTSKPLAEDENSKVKGYGASNQVLASPGTVLVDVATFLVSKTECKGLRKVLKDRADNPLWLSEEELVCEACNTLIGVDDTIAKGWRLFKTSLVAVFPAKGGVATEAYWESHPTELVIAAQLLELIERESARRFIIHCGRNDGLLVWVFNPDMRYSNSSTEHSITSQRAMKVFFQTTANVDELLHPPPGRMSSLSLEELRLPPDTFTSLSDALEESNRRFPRSARTFQQDWSVGILHRYERSKPT
ncbi:HECT-type E3 ubiquitin transferase [Aspergillus lucknowensis]|uniref:Ubiquitin-conjugating enzyme E2-binding protein n=1 Tax=Aspergillus lucknowensis TaxID=176173 RepID=A0ABR4LNR4_9EURO